MTFNFQSPSTTSTPTQTELRSPARIPAWRFWVPLLCQTALILAAPAQPFYTHLTGKTVVLQTAPVDPYDFLRGYSQTLSYEIGRPEDLRRLPGWKELVQQQANSTNASPVPGELAPGTHFYVILEAPTTNASSPPAAWKPVQIGADRPSNLPANQVALKGKWRSGAIAYGLETYYFPEDRREQINQDIGEAESGQERRQGKPLPFVVEVKVDAQGNAVPVSLWVRDRNYHF